MTRDSINRQTRVSRLGHKDLKQKFGQLSEELQGVNEEITNLNRQREKVEERRNALFEQSEIAVSSTTINTHSLMSVQILFSDLQDAEKEIENLLNSKNKLKQRLHKELSQLQNSINYLARKIHSAERQYSSEIERAEDFEIQELFVSSRSQF